MKVSVQTSGVPREPIRVEIAPESPVPVGGTGRQAEADGAAVDEEKTRDEEQRSVTRHDPSGFMRALVSLHIHQDRLMWGRMQLLVALQAAVLGSSYFLRSMPWFAAVVIVLGGACTVLLFFLMKRDEQARDLNGVLIQELGEMLSTVHLGAIDTDGKFRFRLGDAPKWPAPIRGRVILFLVVVALGIVDVLVLCLVLTNSFPPPQ